MKTLIAALFLAAASAGCSTATYLVLPPGTPVGVDEPALQSVSADAPGGEAYVLVVYYGPDHEPTVKANGDSTALVEATAAAGRKAVALALKLAKP